MTIKLNLRRQAVRQFIRFVMVGVLNTLITLLFIFVCHSLWHINQYVSNAIGYVAGLINSFVWNKLWVFNSHHRPAKRTRAEAVKFGVGFLVCYGIQFFVTWFLNTPMDLQSLTWSVGNFTLSGYALATVIGMGVYTVCNFVFNRLVTFK